jgi:hypothetical protein
MSSNDNKMVLYDAIRSVPDFAKKPIQGGRLKGKTDINPQWRIRTLTEQFGPCGIGWKIQNIKKWREELANGEIGAFVDLELVIKHSGQWSDPIPGHGGNALISKTKNGLESSDEGYKMAFTDALSVAFKMIGGGADVYSGDNRDSKYGRDQGGSDTTKPEPQRPVSEETGTIIGYVDVVQEVPKFAGWFAAKILTGTDSAESVVTNDSNMRGTLNTLRGYSARIEWKRGKTGAKVIVSVAPSPDQAPGMTADEPQNDNDLPF